VLHRPRRHLSSALPHPCASLCCAHGKGQRAGSDLPRAHYPTLPHSAECTLPDAVTGRFGASATLGDANSSCAIRSKPLALSVLLALRVDEARRAADCGRRCELIRAAWSAIVDASATLMCNSGACIAACGCMAGSNACGGSKTYLFVRPSVRRFTRSELLSPEELIIVNAAIGYA
jgi:hypothetical protein